MEPSLEEDLILKEEHLSKLFDSFFNRLSQEHILFSHKEGILHFVSDGILKISKKEARKLIGQHFKDILNWTDESISLYMRQYEKIILHQTNYVEFEMSFYDTADTERMLHIIQYARYDQDGNIASIDGLAQDITYIKKIGKENRYLHSVIDEFSVYVKTDPTGIIIEVSDGFSKEFGQSKDFFIGEKINILQSGKTSQSHYKALWKAIQAGDIFEHDIQNCNLMMEPHWYHVKIIPQLKKDKTIVNYIAFYYNIDDKVQLKKEAHTDQLTGLMNRQYLQHIQLKINLNNFDVMIIDLDHFKVVNDSYGHQVGDSVLKNIALILRHLTNSNDILVRYGGEEFLYLLYNPLHDVNMTRDVSERIRLSIEETHIKYGAEDIKISASIGIDANTDMSQNFQEAISRADEMLYLAKRKGRNRIEVYAE